MELLTSVELAPSNNQERRNMNKRIVNIEDFRRDAKKRLPKMVFDFLEGGALDELTLRTNQTQFEALLLRQRALVDVAGIDTTTTVLGQKLSFPLMVSPMGLLTTFHPSADLAVARAAAQAGSIFIHSAWSGCSLEDVVREAPHNTWAQISFWSDHGETREHIARAKDAGVNTLVITGDVAVSSKRERDLHHGLSLPPRPPMRDYFQTATRPGWIWRWLTGPRISYGNYKINGRQIKMRDMEPWMDHHKNESADWKMFAELRSEWSGNLVVKGIMAPQDATQAVAEGADGIFVSNHGGRQFDSQPATIEVLPSIVDATAGRAEVYLDGGVRRGSDIAKALGLGVRAALVGRPMAYALASGGQAAVEQAFRILHDELKTTMGFLGKTSIHDLDESVFSDVVRR